MNKKKLTGLNTLLKFQMIHKLFKMKSLNKKMKIQKKVMMILGDMIKKIEKKVQIWKLLLIKDLKIQEIKQLKNRNKKI